MTPKAFNKRMLKIGATIAGNADKLFRATALIVDSAVVIGTPVDTGRARSNWQVGAPGPVTSERGPYSPGAEGSTGGANAQAAIAQAKAVIGATKEKTIYISNNVKYMEFLNQGSSAQAPAGFVEAAVELGRQEVRKANLMKGT